MKKRLLSFLLTIVMVCTMIPLVPTGTYAASYDVINKNGVTGAEIVAQARRYLGVPYDTSGGNYKYRTGFGSTMMFDCSGFVYRVCRDVGLASSRANYTMGQNDPWGNPLEGKDSNGNYYITAHTQEQRYYGQDISSAVKKYMNTGDYSDLYPGDLLFVTADNSNVSHVVIYAGNGKIVHSEGYAGCVSEHHISRYSYSNSSNWYFDGCRLVGYCDHSYSNVGVCSKCKREFDFNITRDTSCAGTYKVNFSGGIDLRSSKPYSAADKNGVHVGNGVLVEVSESVENCWGKLWYKVIYNGRTGYTSADNLIFLGYNASNSSENYISCDGLVENTEHAEYMNLMMNHYISSNSNLQNALSNGKSVVFMFEGGSDFYPSKGYSTSGSNERVQGETLVVRRVNGKNKVVFANGYSSSVPSQPRDTSGGAYDRQTTLLDGIYRIQTCNHQGKYGALNVITDKGYYTPPSNPDGLINYANGINIHTRSSGAAGSGDSAWSWGCHLIGTGTNGEYNNFNRFMKAVTEINYNVWISYPSEMATITAGIDVGYYVVDRQLALDGLTALYTDTALRNITEFSRNEYNKATGNFECTHSYVSSLTEPTCTTDGIRKFTCSICGDSYSESVPAHGHVWGDLQTDWPNCVTEGREYRVCSKCHAEDVVSILPTNNSHCIGPVVIEKAATCISAGVAYSPCVWCGYKMPYDLPADPEAHIWEELVVPPKCGTPGELQRYCHGCEKFEKEAIPATGEHEWGEWYVSTPATESSEGTEHRVCMNCKKYESRVIPKLDSETVKYPVEGGDIYFNKLTGRIIDCDESVVSADIPKVIDGVNVTSISDDAFSKCVSLKSITIPDSIASIGISAFMGCTSLTSITIPNSVTDINRFAFEGCSSLTSVVIPDSVKTISLGMFMHCTSLESVIIPDNLTLIDAAAFSGCTSLTSVTIPDSIVKIGDSVFKDCSSLSDIYYSGTQSEWNQIEIYERDNDPFFNATIHYESSGEVIGCEHKWSSWRFSGSPCENDTVKFRECVNCGAVETNNISATGHNWSGWRITNPADCENDGAEGRECQYCGKFETRTVPAAGHIYGEWIVTVEPTAVSKGEKIRKCRNCDATETKVIDELGSQPSYQNPFTDVKEGQWYTDGILWCYHNEYMAGVSDTDFGRKSNVTRAMFATILAKIDGSDISGYSKMSFTDVKPNQWYSNAIEWAASNGYAAGLGEGIFGYKQNVSREQIALFFYTYSSKNGIDVSAETDLSGYADLNRVHSWALDAVEWAVAKGLISGTSETTLSPRDSANRAEIALIIKNYVENVKN